MNQAEMEQEAARQARSAEVEVVQAEVVPSAIHAETLSSGPIPAGGIAQVRYQATVSGRLRGLRAADGGRIVRVIAGNHPTTHRKPTDPTWREILRDRPIPIPRGTMVIFVVGNDTSEPTAFEIGLEMDLDPSLDPRTEASGGRSSSGAAPRPGANVTQGPRTRDATPARSAVRTPQNARLSTGARPVESSATSKARTAPAARADDEPIYVILDRFLVPGILGHLERHQYLSNDDHARTLMQLETARSRRERPTTRELVVALPYGLVVRLDAAVRRNVRLGPADVAAVVKAIREAISLSTAPSARSSSHGVAAPPAGLTTSTTLGSSDTAMPTGGASTPSEERRTEGAVKTGPVGIAISEEREPSAQVLHDDEISP